MIKPEGRPTKSPLARALSGNLIDESAQTNVDDEAPAGLVFQLVIQSPS